MNQRADPLNINWKSNIEYWSETRSIMPPKSVWLLIKKLSLLVLIVKINLAWNFHLVILTRSSCFLSNSRPTLGSLLSVQKLFHRSSVKFFLNSLILYRVQVWRTLIHQPPRMAHQLWCSKPALKCLPSLSKFDYLNTSQWNTNLPLSLLSIV